MISIEKEIKVQFFDCDPMGVVWNGKYFDYFEMVRADLLAKYNLSYIKIAEKGYQLPLVKNKIKYIKPLPADSVFKIKATVTEYEIMLKIKYEITDLKTGIVTTKGESTQAATDLQGNSVGHIPDFIIDAIKKDDN